jgi:hypothetical protein
MLVRFLILHAEGFQVFESLFLNILPQSTFKRLFSKKIIKMQSRRGLFWVCSKYFEKIPTQLHSKSLSFDEVLFSNKILPQHVTKKERLFLQQKASVGYCLQGMVDKGGTGASSKHIPLESLFSKNCTKQGAGRRSGRRLARAQCVMLYLIRPLRGARSSRGTL